MNRLQHIEALYTLIKSGSCDTGLLADYVMLYSAKSGRSVRTVQEYAKVLYALKRITLDPDNWYLSPVVEAV